MKLISLLILTSILAACSQEDVEGAEFKEGSGIDGYDSSSDLQPPDPFAQDQSMSDPFADPEEAMTDFEVSYEPESLCLSSNAEESLIDEASQAFNSEVRTYRRREKGGGAEAFINRLDSEGVQFFLKNITSISADQVTGNVNCRGSLAANFMGNESSVEVEYMVLPLLDNPDQVEVRSDRSRLAGAGYAAFGMVKKTFVRTSEGQAIVANEREERERVKRGYDEERATQMGTPTQ